MHNGAAHRQGSDQGAMSHSRGGSEVEPGSVPLQGRAASGPGPSQSTAAAAAAVPGGGGGPSQDQQVRQRMMSALVARLSKEQRQALSEMSPQQQVTSYIDSLAHPLSSPLFLHANRMQTVGASPSGLQALFHHVTPWSEC